MFNRPAYALSIKQPWAALLVSGRKTIEIRKWATTIRGKLYIHAARDPDDRPEGWAHITDELRPLAELGGGVIGTAELAACIMYRTAKGFAADGTKHLNAPNWFVAPRLYGFEFRNPTVIEFFPFKGNVKFFTVTLPISPEST